ncbi:aBC transporter related protein [Clostridium sp. CAG:1000]|nr:ABC transporter ATP-binding protein [Clostridium sp.]CCX36496.1 aBC transporter related protein [Clostridium sp. CAG:1000]
MKKAIKVRNVSKEINGRKILDNINFDIYEGEIVGLVGPNGAGKSTLLKIMSGLYPNDEGLVEYYSIDLKHNYEKAMSLVGTLIESPDLYKNLSGFDNLELFKSMFKDVDEKRIKEIVEIVEMEKHLGKKFKTYSLGMKERLGIAASLINKPKILILDEPTNGLDPIGVKNVMNLLKEMKGTTILISSHLLSEIEQLCDRVIFINSGKIVSIKTLDKSSNKKNVTFEVNDFSKAKLLLYNYCINDNLEVYETDETISKLTEKLVFNNIKVYRIYENDSLKNDFFSMVNND